MLLVVVQAAIILYHIALFDTAVCYIYILFLLMLPLGMNRLTLLGLGFVLGITIDLFDDTGGIHGAACVFLAFVRPIIVKAIVPQTGYDNHSILTLKTNGFQWFLLYIGICTIIHHVFMYVLEMFNFSHIWTAIGNAILSSIFTITVILLIQYLFFVPRRFK